MEYFLINKHTILDENILYVTKNIYRILSHDKMDISKIISEYEKIYGSSLGLNIETNIYLSIAFLYVTNKIILDGNKLKLKEM
jgi:hypothetical protein